MPSLALELSICFRKLMFLYFIFSLESLMLACRSHNANHMEKHRLSPLEVSVLSIEKDRYSRPSFSKHLLNTGPLLPQPVDSGSKLMLPTQLKKASDRSKLTFTKCYVCARHLAYSRSFNPPMSKVLLSLSIYGQKKCGEALRWQRLSNLTKLANGRARI